jgi:branched-chain amino acid transport system substrate-binding protein
VSVADGGGGALSASGVTAPEGAIPSLPAAVCGPVFYAGPGRPDALIASDLPFEDDASQTRPMAEAIKFILREHHFRAGRFRIGYQACDDGTAEAGGFTAGKCDADAHAYASTPSVLGVIGTFNSGCAEEEIPITNRAGLAMISPSNSYRGLTQAGPGVLPNQPGSLYPTGRRTYVRVFPADGVQAQAQVVLARQLGLDRVFVIRDSGDGGFGGVLAAGFVQAARGSGVTVTGHAMWTQSNVLNHAVARTVDVQAAKALARRIRASGAKAVDICGTYEAFGGAFVDRLRRLLGPHVPFIAGDAFLFEPGLARARPIYVTNAAVTDPARQLPPKGREFLAAFSGTQPARTQQGFFAVYAAESADVLLQAIAESNGTRPSVVQHLLHVRARDGLLGSFAFTKTGDITIDRLGVYTVSARDGFVFDHIIRCTTAPAGSIIRCVAVPAGTPPPTA